VAGADEPTKEVDAAVMPELNELALFPEGIWTAVAIELICESVVDGLAAARVDKILLPVEN